MKESQIISKLSELPVEVLDRFRITLALAFEESYPSTRTKLMQMADLINRALEQKQLDYYHGFEIVEPKDLGV